MLFLITAGGMISAASHPSDTTNHSESSMFRYMFILAALLLLFPSSVYSQCSDAGACAIGAMHGDDDNEAVTKHLALRYVYGNSGSPDDLRFNTVLLEGSAELLFGSRISVILPWKAIDGPSGSASGIGDITVLFDQQLWENDEFALRAQAGAKLATGEDNAPGLPQAYQPGLGSNDILLGLSLDAAPWNFAIGYQRAGGRSENVFNRLQRGDDLLARMGYRQQLNSIGLGLELIAIKRLSESSIRDIRSEDFDMFIPVPDSDQLQVNVLGTASAPLTGDLRLAVAAAIPMLQRDVNIDGLKRALTLSVGLELGLR